MRLHHLVVLCVANILQQGALAVGANEVMVKHVESNGDRSADRGPTESPQKYGLVIAAVGDHSQHNMWISVPCPRNWDLALIYYGKNATFSCPECVVTLRQSGAKWGLLRDFIKARRPLVQRYGAVMMPDDDLEMVGPDVSRAFEIFKALGLDLGQPSLCSPYNSLSAWPLTFRQPELLAHTTDFVEVMAPMASVRNLYHTMLETLHDAEYGWGLDYLWPFLLGYPDDKVAVIDAVCMHHPYSKQKNAASLYDLDLSVDRYDEMDSLLKRYNFTDQPPHALWSPLTLGEISIESVLAIAGLAAIEAAHPSCAASSILGLDTAAPKIMTLAWNRIQAVQGLNNIPVSLTSLQLGLFLGGLLLGGLFLGSRNLTRQRCIGSWAVLRGRRLRGWNLQGKATV